MQSNGGLTTDAAAAERPMHIIESGPAGGVVGAQALARARGSPNIITFDMGGTTAKAAIVEDGEVTRAQRIRGRRRHHDRLAPADRRRLHAQGAGDRPGRGRRRRRLACLDRRRRRAAGRAARAPAPRPGPVCYDLGGEMPTDHRRQRRPRLPQPGASGRRRAEAQRRKARSVFEDTIADPLGLPLEQAAYGAHLIAASNMIRAIKAVSTERGRDPREFALFAFGGNGPLFACGMAAALGMTRIVVPPCAGLFSSFGLLYADVEHHYARTFRRLLREADLAEIERAWDELARPGHRAARGRRIHRRRARGCAAPPRCTTRARASS